MKRILYISGPITDNGTGLPRENWHLDFLRAEEKLRAMGFDVINPVQLGKVADIEWAVRCCNDAALPTVTPRWFYLQTCLDTLCDAMQNAHHADAVLAGLYLIGYMQPVRCSHGVQAEIHTVKSMGLPVFMELYDDNEIDENLLPIRHGLRLLDGGKFGHENWSE